MERVRHQLACANCMLANANHPVNKDYRFFCKISPLNPADSKFYLSFMKFSFRIFPFFRYREYINISSISI